MHQRLCRRRIAWRQEPARRGVGDVIAQARSPFDDRVEVLTIALHARRERHDVAVRLQREDLANGHAASAAPDEADRSGTSGGIDGVGRFAMEKAPVDGRREALVLEPQRKRHQRVVHERGFGHEVERLAGVAAVLLQQPVLETGPTIREDSTHGVGLDRDFPLGGLPLLDDDCDLGEIGIGGGRSSGRRQRWSGGSGVGRSDRRGGWRREVGLVREQHQKRKGDGK